MTKEQIQSLMEKATKGPWVVIGRHVGRVGAQFTERICSSYLEMPSENLPILAAAPDLAETALDALARVEELEKERATCLKYCELQNSLPYCKNCGLGDTTEDPSETPPGWNPSIKPNS